jgi:hypothetical protein
MTEEIEVLNKNGNKTKKPIELNKLTCTCGFDYDIGHLPFFIVTKKSSGRREIKFKYVKWVFLSGDFPNYNDLDTLLGIVRLYQLKLSSGEVLETNIINKRKIIQVDISGRKLCDYVGKKQNGKNIDRINKSMERLTSLVVYKKTYTNKTVTEFETIRLIVDYGWIEKSNGHRLIRISIDENFLEECIEKNQRVRFQAIQNITGQVSKGCLFYLDCNNKSAKQWISERKLFRFLGLDYPKIPKISTKDDKLTVAKLMKNYKAEVKQYNKKARTLRLDVHESLYKLKSNKLISDWKFRHILVRQRDVNFYLIFKSNYYIKTKNPSKN